MYILSRVLISLSLFLCFALPVQAQEFSTCERWESWDAGGGFTIFNNIWGDGHGPQCLWANNTGDWGFWADHPETGGIKSYPNVDFDTNHDIGSMPPIDASFDVTRPSNGAYNTAFDIWYDNFAFEIMLWFNWTDGMAPISFNWGCDGPNSACPIRTNVNVGGHTWNLYEGTNGSATVYSFLRTSPTNSATVDITAISKWLANNGFLQQSTNLHEIQFGFEVTSSDGGHEFQVNDYNLNIGSDTSGGDSDPVDSSSSTLQNRASSKCIDVEGVSTANNANIVQWDCWDGSNQTFEWRDLGNGYHQLVAEHSGKCLRAANGDVFQYDCNDSYWSEMFERINAGDGHYVLRNRSAGSCLRVENSSSSNGANIVLASCNVGWWSQQFSFQ